MSETIQTIDQLQNYLLGVMKRSGHHAGEVQEAALSLAGAVVLFHDAGTDIKIRTYNDRPANMLWAYIGGSRLAFVYNHETRHIEIRGDSQQGGVLASFDNATPMAEIVETLRGFARVSTD